MSDSANSAPAADPLRSVHTTSFPELLAHLGASVLVTTYQAGKLLVNEDVVVTEENPFKVLYLEQMDGR